MKKQDVITLIDMHLAWLSEQPKVECDIIPKTRILFKNIPVDVFKDVCSELELTFGLDFNHLVCDIPFDNNNTIHLISKEVEVTKTWREKE